MVTPYFSSIRNTLVKALLEAEESIDIAVAWFTNEELFNAVLHKLDDGLRVRLVLINDDINHCGALDFQVFIDKGGQVFFGKNGFFMHNKYCIIDSNTVYTGSYNYTYFAEHSNFENIVCISEDEDAVSKYIRNYEMILGLSDRAMNIKDFRREHPYAVNSHSSHVVISRDAYQKAKEYIEQDKLDLAEKVLERALSREAMPNTFVINRAIFKQWRQPKDCIKRIEVTESSVIVDIQVLVKSSFYIYGPGLDKTWHFLLSDGSKVYANAITNIHFNEGGETAISIPTNTTYFYSEGSSHTQYAYIGTPRESGIERITKSYTKPQEAKSLLCRLIFPKGDYINGPVDLYEGNDNDKSSSHYWHFLRIDMRFNREFTTA